MQRVWSCIQSPGILNFHFGCRLLTMNCRPHHFGSLSLPSFLSLCLSVPLSCLSLCADVSTKRYMFLRVHRKIIIFMSNLSIYTRLDLILGHFTKSWESGKSGRKFCPKCRARVHRKFQDPHFSSVTASQKSGITILAMHL